jgi:hypothetical protein
MYRKNMKNILLILGFICLQLSVKAQYSPINQTPKYRLNIQQIDITNEYLLKYIRKFIQAERHSNDLFRKGFGYVRILDIEAKSTAPVEVRKVKRDFMKDTVLSFTIGLSSMPLLDDAYESLYSHFPAYYAIVDNCLVLLFDDVPLLYQTYIPCGLAYNQSPYSQKSKKKLQQLVENSLKEALDETFEFTSFPSNEKYTLSKSIRKKMGKDNILMQASMFDNKKYTKVHVLRDDNILEEN